MAVLYCLLQICSIQQCEEARLSACEDLPALLHDQARKPAILYLAQEGPFDIGHLLLDLGLALSHSLYGRRSRQMAVTVGSDSGQRP